jgi:succinyl-diaminopimelate desuccinylase
VTQLSQLSENLTNLAQQLMSCPSITPGDAGCQEIISKRLQSLGFLCETLRFGEVDNLWAVYGQTAPLIVFAGHTDVVPTGPVTEWQFPPFQPTIQDDKLYGRGAADMKGALAAMVIAAERFIQQYPNFPGSIAFLLTSDEEGPSINGTKKVIEVLQKRNIGIDYCIIGEPSSTETAGDQIRIGRRGSLHGKLIVHGKQGHVAHPHLAANPIHPALPALAALAQKTWDNGDAHFPPTTFQITHIHSSAGAANVIPGQLEALFNFRFGATTHQVLQQQTEDILHQYLSLPIHDELTWTLGAAPFLSTSGQLITIAQEVIAAINGQPPALSTGGGTSDGRFIIATGAEIIELGTSHATAHHINEHVACEELVKLAQMYEEILKKLF